MKNLLSSTIVIALTFIPTFSNANDLSAMVVGSGSPNHNEQRASAGVYITNGDTKILIDMGDGVTANLFKAGVNDRQLDALMFTHHHVDHNADFISILVRTAVSNNAVSIYGPAKTTTLTNLFLDYYKDDLNYRLGKSGRTLAQRMPFISAKDLKSGDHFNIGSIKVSTLEVPHTSETLAYRFDYNNQSVVITGDLTYIPDTLQLAG